MSEQQTSLTTETRLYLAEIGRVGGSIGGKARTPRKLAAVRKNGLLGGRPKRTDEAKENGG